MDPAKPDTRRARAAILARIRSQQHRQSEPVTVGQKKVDEYLQVRAVGPQPTVGADPVAHFETQAHRMASSTARVAGLPAVPAAVAAYLRDNGLPRAAACWNTLGGLDWAGAGLQVEPRAPTGDDLVGITGVFAGIAETGTLMLLSGPDTPASMHLLPETHIAVLPASRVVAHYEDAFARIRQEHGSLPRAVNLVSGPSRTGDIEQTIVIGAHGPYRVHIVIVDQA